tara:strand:- start:54923 stop:56437 length:1515 start_codon:yes stop_codon:yes gene_type:complete
MINRRLAILVFALCITVSGVAQQEKPNFLLIMTDDQTYESIHTLNNEEIYTPNMDRLVDQGVTFTHAFNQGSWRGAVCVASRTMLLTGQSLFRASQNKQLLSKWTRSKEEYEKTEISIWPEVFSENGYETFITGKWHNSSEAVLQGFDKASALAHGFYESRDNEGNRPGYNRGAEGPEWNPWDAKFNGHWSPTVKDVLLDEEGNKKFGPSYQVAQHTSELFADQAIDYLLNDAVINTSPFLMYVAFNAPHDPRQSPKEYVDRYPASSIKIPHNFMTEHPFDQGDSKVRDEKLAPFPRTKEAVQLHRSEYYAIITHFDHELGRILKALETSGKGNNTYVIMTSDHGLAIGQHGLMGKQNQYDHSIRMPLIINGPGLKAGRKVTKKVYMQSMFATTCELASIEVPNTVDFKSFKALLNGESKGGEDYVFGAYKNLQRMIRSDTYKLIVYPHNKNIQLFDLEKDPYEMENLAFNKKYRKIKEQLLNELIAQQKNLGDFMVLDANMFL